MITNGDSFKLDVILNLFKTRESEFASTFMKDTSEFHRKLVNDAQFSALYLNTKITYASDKVLPLLGGLALLSSDTFKPKTPENSLVPFHIASANGAFYIYDNSYGSADARKAEHFLKVGMEASDYMEAEAVALRMIQRVIQPAMHRYFLTYRASCNLLVYRDKLSNRIYLDLDRYASSDHSHNFFGERTINRPNTVAVPALITRVVQGGLSLNQILSAWRYVTPTNDINKLAKLKDSLRMFHKSALFDRAVNNPVLEDRVANAARTQIFEKLDDFIANVTLSCAPLRLSHGDLHAGNVMYDAETENFVLIDYGRTVVDLEANQVQVDYLIDEFTKIKSKQSNNVRPFLKEANEFYNIFANYGTRKHFDSSEVTTFGVLTDLASLAFFIFMSLKMRLRIPQHPIVHINTYTDSITVASLSDMIGYIENAQNAPDGVTVTDMAITYFGLILRAAMNAGLLEDGLMFLGGSNTDRDASFLIDMDYVYSHDSYESLFYTYGQPFPRMYEKYKPSLIDLATNSKFFPAFEAVAKKKAMIGGRAKAGKQHMTHSKIDIRALTVENYEYNMRRNAEMSIAAAPLIPCQDGSSKSVTVRRSNSLPALFKLVQQDVLDESSMQQKLKSKAVQ